MALFFFHFIDGDDRCEDEIGIELASAETAYLEAIAGAQGMWAELLANRRNPSRCAFEIADRQGNKLFRIDFSELLESCPAPELRAVGQTAGLSQSLRATHLRASAARSDLAASLVAVRAALEESSALLSRLSALERPKRR